MGSGEWYLKDHGLVGVVGHAQLEVPPGEGEARCPERTHLWHVKDGGFLLRLRAVP
jgi:hypothetical protein